MSAPVFPGGLLAAALAFWGWQTGQWLPAAVMSAVLEARWATRGAAPWRWDLGAKDFNRLMDASLLLAVGVAVYLFLTPEGEGAAATFGLGLTQWLPACAFPLAAGQAYSARGRMPLAALLLVRRRKTDKAVKPARQDTGEIDIHYAYFICCLFAAGAANTRSELFFPVVALLLGWLFWLRRPRRYRAGIWLVCFAAATGLGFWGQQAIDQIQAYVRGGSRLDAYRNSTAIGAIGAIKTSDAIVARVVPDQPSRTAPARLTAPLLLREASYTFFSGREWLATDSAFTARVATRASTWELHPGEARASARVYRSFPRRAGLILAPNGALRLEELPARNLETNRLGAIRATNAPGLLGYLVYYDTQRSFDGPPDIVDKVVPPALHEAARLALQEAAGRAPQDAALGLDLARLSPWDAIAALKAYFATRFVYTLALRRGDDRRPAVADFLLKTRAGHCEYFATAAVFVLRAAGIPARYATGFAVQEFSSTEDAYVVREKHAHAWTLVYVDGAWRDFDVTPPVWFALERSQDSVWTRFADARSRLAFVFARWRWLEEKSAAKRWLLWSALTLGALVAYRVLRRQGASRVAPQGAPRTGAAYPGADSEFAAIAARLEREDTPRRQGETLLRWLTRIRRSQELQGALRLHYRYRFDPAGLRPDEREALRETAARWLAGPRRAAVEDEGGADDVEGDAGP